MKPTFIWLANSLDELTAASVINSEESGAESIIIIIGAKSLPRFCASCLCAASFNISSRISLGRSLDLALSEALTSTAASIQFVSGAVKMQKKAGFKMQLTSLS